MQMVIAGMQVRMALRTNRICCGGQPKSVFVLHMAGTASGRERLTRVVQRSVVAGKAGFIRDVLKISHLMQMAQLTLPREHRMRSRKRTAAEGPLSPLRVH